MLLPLLLNNLLTATTGALTGSSSISFSNSAAGSGLAKGTASSSLTFTDASIGSGIANLASSPSIVFGGASQLTGPARGAGITTILFNPNGHLGTGQIVWRDRMTDQQWIANINVVR